MPRRAAGARRSPRVEYELSELAATLIPHAVALADWAVEHNPTIETNRDSYDTYHR